MKFKAQLSFLFILFIISESFALGNEKAVVSGRITTDNAEPVESATISIKNSSYGSITDEKGNFSFSIPAGKYTLVIYALGYETKEVVVNTEVKRENLQIVLEQSAATTLNDVLVTAKSTTQRVNELAYNVVALDAKVLYNSTLDLSHALDRISGVRVRESGGVGSGYNFSLNGFTGNQVKFFIDGVPMDNFGSSFQINNIPINLAERVEVYKGVVPISLGADALGGAVNIVTSNRQNKYVDASYSYGSFNTHRSYINAGYTSESGFTVQINAFQNYSDNDYKVTTDIVDLHTGLKTENVKVKRFHDQYHNETLIANIGVVGKSFADKLLFGITLGKNRADVQTGARMKEFVFGKRFRRGDIVMPTVRYMKRNLFVKGLNLNVTGNFNFGHEQTVDTVARQYNWAGDYIEKPSPGSERNRTMYKYQNNTGIVTANVDYRINDNHVITINNVLNGFNRKGKDELYPESEKYIQPRKTMKNIVGLGYKFDYKEIWNTSVFVKQYHQKTTYSKTEEGSGGWGTTEYVPVYKYHNAMGYGIASTVFVNNYVQLKASYEKSLRMPGNEELFGNEGDNLEGNSTLKPESSHNVNVGANYNTRIADDHGLILDGSLIYRDTKDFIRAKLVTNGTDLVMVNQDKVNNIGFNGEIRYSYRKLLTAGVNMTSQNIRNRTKYVEYDDGNRKPSSTYKDRIPNLPYLFGNADFNLFFQHVGMKHASLTVGYNLLYVHRYYLRWPSEGTKSSKNTIPTQLSHDINLTYTWKDGRYNIAAECKNIFDKDVFDNFSLQKPGRSFYMKFRYFISK